LGKRRISARYEEVILSRGFSGEETTKQVEGLSHVTSSQGTIVRRWLRRRSDYGISSLDCYRHRCRADTLCGGTAL